MKHPAFLLFTWGSRTSCSREYKRGIFPTTIEGAAGVSKTWREYREFSCPGKSSDTFIVVISIPNHTLFSILRPTLSNTQNNHLPSNIQNTNLRSPTCMPGLTTRNYPISASADLIPPTSDVETPTHTATSDHRAAGQTQEGCVRHGKAGRWCSLVLGRASFEDWGGA